MAGDFLVGPPEERCAVSGRALLTEREALYHRLSVGEGLSRPPPWGGLPLGSVPSRRQMLSFVALWSVGRRFPPYPEFVLRSRGTSWTFGGADTPQLTDEAVLALLFEGAQGARPSGIRGAALGALRLDAPDPAVLARMEACAAIWNEAREHQYLGGGFGDFSPLLPAIRPLVARIVAGCSQYGAPAGPSGATGGELVAPPAPALLWAPLPRDRMIPIVIDALSGTLDDAIAQPMINAVLERFGLTEGTSTPAPRPPPSAPVAPAVEGAPLEEGGTGHRKRGRPARQLGSPRPDAGRPREEDDSHGADRSTRPRRGTGGPAGAPP